MNVLVVRPRATGGLAAHVDQEVALLRMDGLAVRESAVRIRERPHPLGDLRAVRRLRAEAGADDVTAVHAHGLRAGALTAIALGTLRTARRPRCVVTLHNRALGAVPTRAVGALLLRVLARGADTVLCVSPDLAELARAAGARDVRHAVVPAPGGTGPAAPPGPDATGGSRGGEDGVLEVLVLARLAPQKGLDDLADAAALLPAERVRIRVAGEGPQRAALERRIREEHLPLTLLGHRTDVPDLLAAADLVVSAARWEGQPVALQEALRAGRAVVATDAGGTRWVTGTAATLVPVGDAVALAEAIRAHLDPDRRRRAERASRERAAELPTARDMSDQLRGLLAPTDPRW